MKKLPPYLMAVLYVAAGTNHFWHPAMYQSIMPPYLPWHTALINISGIAEILLGLLLLPLATRRQAAVGIIFLLIAIFPANVQMTVNYTREHNPAVWISWLRLPLQAVLVWWASRYIASPPANGWTGPTPFPRGRGAAGEHGEDKREG